MYTEVKYEKKVPSASIRRQQITYIHRLKSWQKVIGTLFMGFGTKFKIPSQIKSPLTPYVAIICLLDELTWVQLSSNFWIFLVFILDQNLEWSLEWIYCKVGSSRLVYYSILELFGQRSQYISIKFPLHKPSENPWVCY